MAAPSNPVRSLMLFFVGDILNRNVTPADWGGRHMRSASRLLKKMKYDYDDILGALYSLRDRKYEHFGYTSERELPNKIEGMEILYAWGEPPLIERWLTPPEPPDIWSYDYDKWVREWGKRAIDRGAWFGIYLRQNPEDVKDWLLPIIGSTRFEKSVELWQTLQRTPQQRERSSST